MGDTIPKRIFVDDVWVYANKSENSLILKIALSWGFNIPDFDTWLEKLEPCKAKSELILLRKNLVKEKIEALKGCVQFLQSQMFLIKREDFLLPLAISGNARQTALSRGGNNAKILKTKKSEELSGRIADLYTATKLEHERKDIAFYYRHVIAAFSKKYKDEKPITAYLINKAMETHQKAL